MFKNDVPDTTAIKLVKEPTNENSDIDVYTTVKKRRKMLKKLIQHQNNLSNKILSLQSKEEKIRTTIKETRMMNSSKMEAQYESYLKNTIKRREKLEKELRRCEFREKLLFKIIHSDDYDKKSYKEGRRYHRIKSKMDKVLEITDKMKTQVISDSYLPKR